ncbi:MAG: hypothetical protein AB7N65_15385 [Vicinamibacterales bacterium]
MFHFESVPCACRYRPDVACPLAETLHERAEGELVEEALPCAVCLYHFTAWEPTARQRVYLGKTEHAILLAAGVQSLRFYPLTRRMTVEGQDQYRTRRRFYLAARRLAACGAVRLIRAPTQLPHGRRILLRETTWLQVTALGRVFSTLETAANSYGRRRRHRIVLPARLNAARAQVSAQPDTLLTHYIENLSFLLQRVIEHVSLATPAVVQAQFLHERAAYVRADVHLERLSSTAEATVTQYLLTVQADLTQAAAQERTADRTRRDPLHSHQG